MREDSKSPMISTCVCKGDISVPSVGQYGYELYLHEANIGTNNVNHPKEVAALRDVHTNTKIRLLALNILEESLCRGVRMFCCSLSICLSMCHGGRNQSALKFSKWK